MYRLIAVFLVILCSVGQICHAEESPSTHELQITWHTLLEKSDLSLASIEALPETAWQPLRHEMADFGFEKGTLWLRGDLTTANNGGHIIELSNPLLNHAVLYVLHENGQLEIQQGGFDDAAHSLKLNPYHNQVFEFDVAHAGGKVTLYLQLRAARPLIVWPHVFEDTDFYRQSFNHRIWLGMYCGLFLGLSLLSLMIWVTTRDRDYADFLIFIGTGGLLQAHLLGLLHEQFLYRSAALMEATSVFLPVITAIAYAHFSRHFLDLKTLNQVSDRIMQVCIGLSICIIPLYYVAGTHLVMGIVQIDAVLTGAAGLGAGLKALQRGNRAARFYLIANSILVTGGCIHAAVGMDVFDARPWTVYAFPLAAAINVIVISFALADKVHLLQVAHIRSQQDQLIAEQQMIEVLRESEATLESRVQERTTQLEEALLQQRVQHETLERANHTLSDLHEERGAFLQIAAHDLKNPTAAIISYADLLRERWHAWDEEKKLRRIGNIRSLAQLSYDIIRNLLDINAIETGHFTLRPQYLNPADTLQSVCDSFRERAETKDIAIRLELPSAPLTVSADKTALHQIIDNLVSNAVKYSPQGRKVHVRLEEESGHALIQIRDEGPGISEEDQTRLFRKFTRLTARPTGGEHSTGLGLSIVKHIVEASGGNVGCISRLGEGATFFVSLPLTLPNQTCGKTPPPG